MAAFRFRIAENEPKNYAKEILTIVRENWEKLAASYGLTRRQIEEMRPAFNTCYQK